MGGVKTKSSEKDAINFGVKTKSSEKDIKWVE